MANNGNSIVQLSGIGGEILISKIENFEKNENIKKILIKLLRSF